MLAHNDWKEGWGRGEELGVQVAQALGPLNITNISYCDLLDFNGRRSFME